MTNPGLNPFMLPSRWDQITIGGVTWNGKIEIRGAKRPYKWQSKDTRGAESWDDTYQGLFPKPFTVVFFLYTATQFASWITFSAQFNYYGNKAAPQPVSIYHPALLLIDINSVRVNDVGAVHQISDDHMYAAEVEFMQWQTAPQPGSKAANVTATPTSAKPRNFADLSPTDPRIAPLEAQVQAKQTQLSVTGAQSVPGGTPGG
jgi:hypothetical protein